MNSFLLNNRSYATRSDLISRMSVLEAGRGRGRDRCRGRVSTSGRGSSSGQVTQASNPFNQSINQRIASVNSSSTNCQ